VTELAAALAELEQVLRAAGEDARADWVAARHADLRQDRERVRREVRDRLAGMGSLSDMPAVPYELVRRLDRLTATEPEPSGPPRMVPTGSSSRDLPPR
jgi:hypothetical protein